MARRAGLINRVADEALVAESATRRQSGARKFEILEFDHLKRQSNKVLILSWLL